MSHSELTDGSCLPAFPLRSSAFLPDDVWENWRLLLQDNCWFESEALCSSLWKPWLMWALETREILPHILDIIIYLSSPCHNGVISGLDVVIYSEGKPSCPPVWFILFLCPSFKPCTNFIWCCNSSVRRNCNTKLQIMKETSREVHL